MSVRSGQGYAAVGIRNVAAEAQYEWRDDRVGRWTTVVQEDQRVFVRPCASEKGTLIVGLIIVLVVGSLFLKGLMTYQYHPLGVVLALLAIAATVIGAIRIVARRRHASQDGTLLIYDGETSERAPHGGRVLVSEDIQAVIVRPNHGRDASDVLRWQTYIRVNGSEYCVLLHQSPAWRRRRETRLGEELSNRWRVPLICE